MSCESLLQIIQTAGIIGALIVSISAFIISKRDIISRLRPYIFIHATHTHQTFAKDVEPPNNILKIDYQLVIRCSGQSPAVIKDIKLKETFSKHPELLPEREVSFEKDQIIYPGSDIRVSVPPIGTDVARIIFRGEDIYVAKITIIYSQLGTKKEFVYQRDISYNPKIETGPKIQLKSISKIT